MGCEISCGEETENLDGAKLAIGGSALKETISFLSRVDMFKCLAQEDLQSLARICIVEQFDPGDIIVKQGDPGDALYCLSKGLAKVLVNDQLMANLMPGDYFGEDAILRGMRRAATILAETACTALKVTRRSFQEMELLEKLDFPERPAVVGGVDRPVSTKPASPKTSDEKTLMRKALLKNTNLSKIPHMNDKIASDMIDVAWQESVAAGVDIITEGDLVADYFYIIQKGQFKVTLKPGKGQCIERMVSTYGDARTSHPKDRGGFELGPGDSFGELALLYYTPRAATVTATAASVVWVVDRNAFRKILAQSAADAAGVYVQYFEGIAAFDKLRPDDKKAIANNLVEISYKQGDTVFEQGEEGNTFFVMVSGQVAALKDGVEKQIHEASPGAAKTFGREALVQELVTRDVTLKVKSSAAKFMQIDKLSFDMLVQGVEEYVKQSEKQSLAMDQQFSTKPSKDVSQSMNRVQSNYSVGPSKSQISTPNLDGANIKFKELIELGVLGTGGFGMVKMVEHTPTNGVFALKAISKGLVVQSGMQRSVMEEKRIQLMCDSPFIIKLVATFNSDQTLYFLLELALGGDLFHTYKNHKLAGSATHARFYSAEILHALEHLHSKKVIYRDLKPENVMLSNTGHVKLVDMGLAKQSPGKTYTTCGTPEYFAPEVIWATGYTNAADWWTFGVFIFELMAGKTPFYARDPMEIYANVFKGMAKVKFPECMEGQCRNIVLELCQPKPADRLTMKKGGTQNIKDHEWYIELDWEDIKILKAKPPYEPAIKSKKDMTNFLRKKPPKPPKTMQYTDDKSGWDANFATNE